MRYLFGLLCALFASSTFAAEPKLPEGAIARLGTTQFRTSGWALCLSPDGKRAAVRIGQGIDVLNLDTGEVVAQIRDEKKLKDPKGAFSRNAYYFNFAFASGGKEIVTANAGTEVHVWDAATGKHLRSMGGLKMPDNTPARINTVFNCQLADFVIAETHAGMHKLDAKTGKWTLFDNNYYLIADVSANGRWVSQYTDMASIENYVSVVDTKTGLTEYSGESGGSYPFAQTPSPDGKFVACTVEERGVQLWDIATKKEIKLEDVDKKIGHVRPQFTPDGKTLLVSQQPSPFGGETRFARWDTATGKRLEDWKLPSPIGSWAVDHKNNRLVVIAGQCVIRIDLATGKQTLPPDGFVGRARPAISPDGKFAAVGDEAGKLLTWEAPFNGKPRTLRESGSAVHDLVFLKDGKTLFVGYEDRTASVYDLVADKETTTLKPPALDKPKPDYPRRTNLAASPDGKTLAAEVEMLGLWAWDVPTGKVLWNLKATEKERNMTGYRPVFAPDSSTMYYGREKAEISKFDARTGKELARLAAPVRLKSWVTRLAISPDGKQLAAHTYYNQAELVLFDIAKGEAIWNQKFKLEEMVGALVFAPNGSAVLTTHLDGTIRGWKATTGEKAFVLRGPAGVFERLQLTADSKYAVTDAPSATALVWKLK